MDLLLVIAKFEMNTFKSQGELVPGLTLITLSCNSIRGVHSVHELKEYCSKR